MAFVDESGKATFAGTGSQDSATLAAKDGTLCAASHTTSYSFSSSAMEQGRRRPGSQYYGQATYATPRAGCVYVFNTGAIGNYYTTDVFWGSNEHPRHAAVHDVPGASGVTSDAVWVSNIGSSSTNNGYAKIYRVDLGTRRVTQEVGYRTWPGTAAMRERGWVSTGAAGAGLYFQDGRIYFLEEALLASKRGGGRLLDIAPGSRAQLRLGSVDLSSGKYKSTLLTNLAGGVTDRADGSVSGSAAACYKGAFYGGSIFTCDSEGDILRVNLDRRTVTPVGRLSEAATHSGYSVASFSPNSLTMFMINSGSGRTRAEVYDLRTGRRKAGFEVDGVQYLLKHEAFVATDAAELG